MVFDYVAGKEDWLASDLPFEGELADARTLGGMANREVPTCAIHEAAQQVRARLERTRNDFCVVVSETGVVLGLVRRGRENSEGTVEQIMEPGPTTLRPHTTAAAAADLVRKRKLDPLLITLPDGRLVGAVRAKDLE